MMIPVDAEKAFPETNTHSWFLKTLNKPHIERSLLKGFLSQHKQTNKKL